MKDGRRLSVTAGYELSVTWVVGASSILGVGLLAADVRVSFPDGTTRDMLQKVHPIGPFVGIGFAGSVKAGFAIIEELRKRYPPLTPPLGKGYYDPELVAQDVRAVASDVFGKQAAEERRIGCQLLIVGCSPKRELGLPGATPIAIARFVSPHFVPNFARRDLYTSLHMGSGSKVQQYKRAIRTYFKNIGPTLSRQTSGLWQFWPQMFASEMGDAIAKNVTDGISPHLHLMVIKFGSIGLGKNDRDTYGENGSEFRMPPTATSYSEFMAMCALSGTSYAAAVA